MTLLGIDACPMEGFAPAEYDAILGLEAKDLTSVVICSSATARNPMPLQLCPRSAISMQAL
jgi:hypothetical protein